MAATPCPATRADLLYVASGATLTISNLKPATNAPTSTVNVVLGNSGNFDVAGTADDQCTHR